MSEELKNITNGVMDQIHLGKVKMRPKIYFILGSVLTFTGLVSSIMISVFLVGLIRFSLRVRGPMGEYKLDQMISEFPWWTIIFTIASLVIGIWLIRQYDFSYKKELWLVVLAFILSIVIVGLIVDMLGLNDTLSRRGPMKGMMRGYMHDSAMPKGPMWKK